MILILILRYEITIMESPLSPFSPVGPWGPGWPVYPRDPETPGKPEIINHYYNFFYHGTIKNCLEDVFLLY